MADKDWRGKDDKLPRRSPRRKGKTCGRPFKAPRPVSEKEADKDESQVEIITETENERDIQTRQEVEPHGIPFIPGIRMMSEREAQETAEFGEVLRWSSDSEAEPKQGKPKQTERIVIPLHRITSNKE